MGKPIKPGLMTCPPHEIHKEEYLMEEKQAEDVDFTPSTAASDRTKASGNEHSTMRATRQKQLNQNLTGVGTSC